MDSEKKKFKHYLQSRIRDLEKEIKSQKRKMKIISSLNVSLIVISIIGSSIITIISGMTISPIIISIVSIISAVSAGFSMRFKLKSKKAKLSKSTKDLSVLKNKFDYIVSCNGSLTEDEYQKLLKELIDIK